MDRLERALVDYMFGPPPSKPVGHPMKQQNENENETANENETDRPSLFEIMKRLEHDEEIVRQLQDIRCVAQLSLESVVTILHTQDMKLYQWFARTPEIQKCFFALGSALNARFEWIHEGEPLYDLEDDDSQWLLDRLIEAFPSVYESVEFRSSTFHEDPYTTAVHEFPTKDALLFSFPWSSLYLDVDAALDAEQIQRQLLDRPSSEFQNMLQRRVCLPQLFAAVQLDPTHEHFFSCYGQARTFFEPKAHLITVGFIPSSAIVLERHFEYRPARKYFDALQMQFEAVDLVFPKLMQVLQYLQAQQVQFQIEDVTSTTVVSDNRIAKTLDVNVTIRIDAKEHKERSNGLDLIQQYQQQVDQIQEPRIHPSPNDASAYARKFKWNFRLVSENE